MYLSKNEDEDQENLETFSKKRLPKKTK